MTKLEQKLAKEEELAKTASTKAPKAEKSAKPPKKGANVMKKSKKITKKAQKSIEKEVKAVENDKNGAIATLVKVARNTKGHSLSGTGRQIIDDMTGEVKCCVRERAKVTMPMSELPEAWREGLRKCEGNHHMTWIPYNHPHLEDIFKKRLADKRTMYQFEKKIYNGPSPARLKVLGKSKGTKEALANIQARIKALQEKEKSVKAALKAKKATKATKGHKVAKATA